MNYSIRIRLNKEFVIVLVGRLHYNLLSKDENNAHDLINHF